MPTASTGVTLGVVFGAILVLVAVALGLQAPEIKRYLKIKRM